MRDVMSYSGYIINGHHFHTRDVNISTQDSGVSMEADTIVNLVQKTTHLRPLGKLLIMRL